jgi:dTDP-4-dehydrorhamnose reductase
LRILVTGADGQLGSEVCRLSKHDTYGTYLSGHGQAGKTKFVSMDVTDAAAVSETVRKLKPDWVVHCAAMTGVDSCETNREAAWNVNVDGTKNLVHACRASGAAMVYVSTDYVFDGKKGNYKETDVPNPLNYYARTKLAGEMIASTLEKYMVVRSSVIFSAKKNNFVSWVLESLKAGRTKVVTDQINSPTLAAELAECMLELIAKKAEGVYHAAGAERISRYDFARKIAKDFGADEKLIMPIKTAELGQKAVRPADSSLDIEKVKRLCIVFSNVDGALRKLKGMKEA